MSTKSLITYKGNIGFNFLVFILTSYRLSRHSHQVACGLCEWQGVTLSQLPSSSLSVGLTAILLVVLPYSLGLYFHFPFCRESGHALHICPYHQSIGFSKEKLVSSSFPGVYHDSYSSAQAQYVFDESMNQWGLDGKLTESSHASMPTYLQCYFKCVN